MYIDMNKEHWLNGPCPKYDCRKNSCKCGLKYVNIPAVLGDDSDDSKARPENGQYCNAVVEYEANGAVYVYSTEGIPIKLNQEDEDGKKYSLSEVDTGKKWIDGRTVYSKTYNLGALPANPAPKVVPNNINNLDRIIGISGWACYASDSPGATPVYIVRYGTGAVNEIGIITSHTHVGWSVTSGDYSHYAESYITLEYIKEENAS